MERDFKGVWIPKNIWLDNNLGWTEKLLLIEIDSLVTNGECFASNQYFASFFNLSKDRISKIISELNKKGYIELKMVYKKDSKQIEKRIITTKGYRRKQLEGIGENTDRGIGENYEDNNTSFNKPINNTVITSSFNKLPSKQSKYLNTTDFINDFSHIKDSLKRQILVAYYDSFVEVHKTQHFKLTAEEIKEITTKLDEFYRLTDQLNPEEYTQVDLINKCINYFFSNGETHSIHRFFNHSTIMYVFVQLNIINTEGFEVDGSIKTDYSDDIA